MTGTRAPRGIRNNNPGNIRHTGGIKWAGMADPPSDGSFCRFVSPEMGLRAIYKILRSYRKNGLTTITDIIRRWAPDNENDTNAYIRSVSYETGFDADAEIDVRIQNVAIPLVRAIVVHENGRGPEEMLRYWYDFETYVHGFLAAQPEGGSS